MQSSINVKLSPQEEMTVTVTANDLGDFVEGAIGVMWLPWLAECDSNECIPVVPVQELRPSLF